MKKGRWSAYVEEVSYGGKSHKPEGRKCEAIVKSKEKKEMYFLYVSKFLIFFAHLLNFAFMQVTYLPG